MTKIVINHLEKVFVTADCATILSELEVNHPAAKLLSIADARLSTLTITASKFCMRRSQAAQPAAQPARPPETHAHPAPGRRPQAEWCSVGEARRAARAAPRWAALAVDALVLWRPGQEALFREPRELPARGALAAALRRLLTC